MTNNGILQGSDTLHKKPVLRRRESTELPVFDAAQYYSGGTDYNSIGLRCVVGDPHLEAVAEERVAIRKSLDMPMETTLPKEKTKSKQPSSPGRRLARFLSSLIHHHSSSSKTKKSIKPTKDGDDHRFGERKSTRRSSISHSPMASRGNTSSSMPIYPWPSYSKSKSSGLIIRTSPTYDQYSGGKSYDQEEARHDKRISDGSDHKELVSRRGGGLQEEEEEELDHGGEMSDSSSDLFELLNYEIIGHEDIVSAGLPLFSTTDMEVAIGSAAVI